MECFTTVAFLSVHPVQGNDVEWGWRTCSFQIIWLGGTEGVSFPLSHFLIKRCIILTIWLRKDLFVTESGKKYGPCISITSTFSFHKLPSRTTPWADSVCSTASQRISYVTNQGSTACYVGNSCPAASQFNRVYMPRWIYWLVPCFHEYARKPHRC